jgi:hypothetical protein
MTFSLSKILHSLTAMCLLLNLSACSGVETASWTEEVRLHDGRFIEVSRKVKSHKGGMLSDSGTGGNIEFEIKYAPMKVVWKGPAELSPASFEIFDGVPHLVFFIHSSKYCIPKKKSDYADLFMRWREGQWEEVAQADFPIDKALMNLYLGYTVGMFGKDPTKGRVTWDIKAAQDGYYTQERDAIVIDPRDTVGDLFSRRKQTCNNQFEEIRNNYLILKGDQ